MLNNNGIVLHCQKYTAFEKKNAPPVLILFKLFYKKVNALFRKFFEATVFHIRSWLIYIFYLSTLHIFYFHHKVPNFKPEKFLKSIWNLKLKFTEESKYNVKIRY